MLRQHDVRNGLLRALPAECWPAFAPHLDRVTLQEGEVLASPDEPIGALFFPEGAVISLLDAIGDAQRVEIGLVGYEGMIGWPVLLRASCSPFEATVQLGGSTAVRIGAAPFVAACRRSAAAERLFLAFVQTLTAQLGRTVASTLCDPVERRLGRWLLMWHDRVSCDEIDLTHRHIASMLSLRRASVTDALHVLEGEGMIRCRRKRVTIRSRAALRTLAAASYGCPEACYREMIGPFGKG